jgi:hypothetical protein
MPLHEVLILCAFVMAGALAASLRCEPLRRSLRRWPTWAVLALGGSLGSLVSALSRQTGHSGDRLLTRYGWPKPFGFSYLDEAGRRVTEVELLYAAGNAAFYAALGLAFLTVWSVLQDRSSGSGRSPRA